MALWALIAIGYISGQPADVEISPQDSETACHENAAKSLKIVQPKLQGKIEIVYKCADLSQLPIAAAGFGTSKSTEL